MNTVSVEILPVPGLPEFRPGDDLAGAVAAAAPWLADGDVLVAVVRGLSTVDDGHGSAPLVRPVAEDMFALGTAEARALGRREAVPARRSVRSFSADPVDPDAV